MIQDLLNEDVLKPKKKKKVEASTIILTLIIILVILLIVSLVAIVYIKGTILSFYVDDEEASDLEEILIFEENNKIYMPIRRMAQYLYYDTYNGDYKTLSEDATKCYIVSTEELVSFTLNSNILTKVSGDKTKQIKIDEPIKEINGELCITSEGAQEAFNIIFTYDLKENEINIDTLQYLYDVYSTYYKNKGYSPIESETFSNKMAILDGMLIVKAENNRFGVIASTGETILETKYDSIQYLRETSDFLVKSNDHYGIISKDKTTKVSLTYESIEQVINENDIFYVVKETGFYGLLDVDGSAIIYPEYEQIGIDVSLFEQNGVSNGYILYDKIIPVKRENKWALFNIEGKKITDFVYDSLGCTVAKNNLTRAYGVLEVMDYNLIVVSENNKYNLVNLKGELLFNGFVLDSVYITVSEGKIVYYITSGTTTKELIGFLEEKGIQKPSK